MEFLVYIPQMISFIMDHGLEIVGAVVMLCNALIIFFLFVPGDQPETFLKSVVEFLSKYSKK